ncbi:DUF4192 domain-containing protein [Streptomyces sp. YGL11-2]|uniref:DUF4192 domain-containing protein n=1 Tax=Streptomyces sp. YGL11-2 TaxID=3414028 RepID=UPI003CEA5131
MNPHSEPRKPGTDNPSPASASPPSASPPEPPAPGAPPGPPVSADPTRAADPTAATTPATPFIVPDPSAPSLSCNAYAPADPTASRPSSAPAGSQADSRPRDATAPDETATEPPVTLRGPAELADALPYLMGFYPDDSIVMVALHGERARFGGRLRLGIPTDTTQWPDVCDQLADCLITGARDRATRPVGILVFLCQEPSQGESGKDVRDRLRPLAQRLRTACGAQDVPVLEALCISNGRFWSYCCPDFRCCPTEGTPLFLPGTSVMAAAAAYAGMQVRGSLKEMEARLAPRTGPRAADQEQALDAAAATLMPRMLRRDGAPAVRRETLDLAHAMICRFRQDTPTGSNRARDACDDALITDREAADLVLGLQDRGTRDRAAEWMDGPEAAPALRLWRALARRCAGGYVEHAAAPLTLAGWVCWSTADDPSARVALTRALTVDPGYVFAQMLHRAINDGLDPEPLRRCLREQRREAERAADGPAVVPEEPQGPAKRPGPPRPGAADRPRGPRGGTGPGTRTPGAAGKRRTGRDGDRSRR